MHVYEKELTQAALVAFDADQLANARVLLDVDMRWDGSQIRYSGIWGEIEPGASLWGQVNMDEQAWDDFIDDMRDKDGRWLDIEVGIFGGNKRWSALFLEDGDDYGFEVQTSLTESGLESKLDENLDLGRQVIDFEAYEENGDTKYGALWVSDPNQPRTSLYYHLTSAQLGDLVNPQYPIDPSSGLTPIGGMTGYVIDLERYYSTLHGETRYAVILSNHPGNSLWLSWGSELSSLDADDATYSDANTRIVDLDVYESGGQLRYLGVWQDDVKSLSEVDGLPAEPDPEPIDPGLQAVIDSFETRGDMAIYARNVRTHQSISYRASTTHYLASVAKVPMHVYLWQLDEDGEIDLFADQMQYTLNSGTGNPWYVDNRDSTGALGPNDFGQSFSLATLDSFMLVQSDNSATSMLFEMQLGSLAFNRWLSGINDVGRGFHPFTSIAALDRVIMWQGQVNDFPSAQSYWSIPSWIWEPWFRTGSDTFGWLQSFVGAGNPFPGVDLTVGYPRYFRMGLNSVEPRALGQFLERWYEGDFFDTAATTTQSLNVLGSSTPLRNALDGTQFFPGLSAVPSGQNPSALAKNGSKGQSANGTRVVNDVAIFQKGPDAIAMVVMSQNGQRQSATVRATWTPQIGWWLYDSLISDLIDAGPFSYQVSDFVVEQNATWSILVDVRNDRGGDATTYKVRFYASVDPTITSSDMLIGEYTTPVNHPGHTDATVGLQLDDFPETIPAGVYFVGWIIDEDNDVGEWDDSLSDNTVVLRDINGTPLTLAVTRPTLDFDFNHDFRIDLHDTARFQACFTGPDIPATRECSDANIDGDLREDVDAEDWAIFERCMRGPDKLLDPDCVESTGN